MEFHELKSWFESVKKENPKMKKFEALFNQVDQKKFINKTLELLFDDFIKFVQEDVALKDISIPDELPKELEKITAVDIYENFCSFEKFESKFKDSKDEADQIKKIVGDYRTLLKEKFEEEGIFIHDFNGLEVWNTEPTASDEQTTPKLRKLHARYRLSP